MGLDDGRQRRGQGQPEAEMGCEVRRQREAGQQRRDEGGMEIDGGEGLLGSGMAQADGRIRRACHIAQDARIRTSISI
jgi:hypothetical protein